MTLHHYTLYIIIRFDEYVLNISRWGWKWNRDLKLRAKMDTIWVSISTFADVDDEFRNRDGKLKNSSFVPQQLLLISFREWQEFAANNNYYSLLRAFVSVEAQIRTEIQ